MLEEIKTKALTSSLGTSPLQGFLRVSSDSTFNAGEFSSWQISLAEGTRRPRSLFFSEKTKCGWF